MDVLQFVLLGLGTGAAYALTALGVVVAYRGSGVLSFAQAAMGMFVAYLFFGMRDDLGWATGIGLPVALAAGAAIGAVAYLVVLRPLEGAPAYAKIVATLGLLVLLQGVATMLWSADQRLVAPVLPNDAVSIGDGVVIAADRLWLAALALVLTIALTVGYRWSRFGIATSAVAESHTSAAALGRSPHVIACANFAIGGALAGVAATLLAPTAGLSVTGLSLLIVPAIGAALAGGFRSFPVTATVALAIGVAQSLTANYVHVAGVSTSVPLLVVVVVLLARGSALPGRGAQALLMPRVGSGRVRPLSLLGAVLVAGTAIALLAPRWNDALATTLSVGVVLLSVVVVTGYAGQLSLAQYTLAGFGGWVAARLSGAVGGELELTILIAVACTVPVALVVAVCALRTRGPSLAVATMGLAVVLDSMVLQNTALTNGATGIEIEPARAFGFAASSVDHPTRYAFACLVVFAVCGLVVANVRRGSTGRRLLAVRSNERAAASVGISVVTTKIYAFAVAGGLAGAGGALLVLPDSHTTLQGYDLLASINAVVWAVVGGVGFVAGGAIGALLAPGSVLAAAVDGLGDDVAIWLQVFAGAATIQVVLQFRDGLAAAATTLLRRLTPRGRAAPADASGPSAASLRAASAAPLPRVRQHELRVSDLTVRFGGVVAVDRVSLVVRPGTVVGLIGPNGAGKTTLIDAISGFVRPAAGSVALDSEQITGATPAARARRGVVRTFQGVDLFEDLSVADNLLVAAEEWAPSAYARDLVRPRSAALDDAAGQVCREFELDADLARLPAELPYGKRRLVGIARALVARPSVLFLDEPAAGLDTHETAELARLIRRIADEAGAGVLLVEHDVETVFAIADRVCVLQFGRVIADGPPDVVRRDPAVIAAYLGSEERTPVEAQGTGPC